MISDGHFVIEAKPINIFFVILLFVSWRFKDFDLVVDSARKTGSDKLSHPTFYLFIKTEQMAFNFIN
jgi:hypothetical protein